MATMFGVDPLFFPQFLFIQHIPNFVVSLHGAGARVYACDIQESVFYIRYKPRENQLVVFADDTLPKWVTASCILDFDTMAVGDKFGNLSIVRLPAGVSDDVDEDPTGNKALWDRGYLCGASNKVESVTNFHVGETISSLQVT